MRVLFTEWRVIRQILSSFIFCKVNGDKKSQKLHLSTCIQLRMTKHPSRKVMNFRHSLGCDTIDYSVNVLAEYQLVNLKIECEELFIAKSV